ncbi:MAG: hypothetical protein ABID45_04595 [Patescibacteria group bacterium]
MKLSALQKYILLEVLQHKGKYYKKDLLNYYKDKDKKPSKEDQFNIITKSVERMIDKGLLIGYGRKTPEKMFIKRLRLTDEGRKTAIKIRQSKQQKFNI